MAQILVRDLDEKVVVRLKKRAEQSGRSLQTEVKLLLEQAAQVDYTEGWKAVDRLRTKLKRSGRTFSDSTKLLREDRDR
jgi:antitoxin FitA